MSKREVKISTSLDTVYNKIKEKLIELDFPVVDFSCTVPLRDDDKEPVKEIKIKYKGWWKSR